MAAVEAGDSANSTTAVPPIAEALRLTSPVPVQISSMSAVVYEPRTADELIGLTEMTASGPPSPFEV